MPPTQANLKHAHRVAAEIRDKIRVGIFSIAEYFPVSGAGGARTVGDHLDAWLGTKRIESSSRAGYESAIKFWKTAPRDNSGHAISDIVLRTLRKSHLLHGIASRPALSGKTINNYVSVMRDALDLALADKLIDENPATGIARAKHQKPPPDPFSREEADKIVSLATDRFRMALRQIHTPCFCGSTT